MRRFDLLFALILIFIKLMQPGAANGVAVAEDGIVMGDEVNKASEVRFVDAFIDSF